MIKEERLDRLTEYAKTKHYVSIDELTKLLGVSRATVRRDLLSLQEHGIVTLSHGGALYKDSDSHSEPLYFEKSELNIHEKQCIGEIAASLISPGETVFVGAGTTTRCMVPFLDALSSFNLVTNDILVAADSTNFTNINVTVTGGQLRKNYYTLRGFAAENHVKKLHIDVAFWGMDAIDVNSGCYISNTDEVALIQNVIDSAEKVVLLCDHSKFRSKAFMMVCPLTKIDVIITDKSVDSSIVSSLEDQGIEVILA